MLPAVPVQTIQAGQFNNPLYKGGKDVCSPGLAVKCPPRTPVGSKAISCEHTTAVHHIASHGRMCAASVIRRVCCLPRCRPRRHAMWPHPARTLARDLCIPHTRACTYVQVRHSTQSGSRNPCDRNIVAQYINTYIQTDVGARSTCKVLRLQPGLAALGTDVADAQRFLHTRPTDMSAPFQIVSSIY